MEELTLLKIFCRRILNQTFRERMIERDKERDRDNDRMRERDKIRRKRYRESDG